MHLGKHQLTPIYFSGALHGWVESEVQEVKSLIKDPQE